MFRGSTYSVESENDMVNTSEMLEQNVVIGIIGASEVGKTSMLACIQNEPFNEDINPTKKFQIRFKKLRINNIIIKLKIWDGSGDKLYDFMKEGKLSNVDGFIQVFDLIDRQSLYQLQGIHQQLKKHVGAESRQFMTVLVGNKTDLLPQHQNEQEKMTLYLAQKFAKNQNLLYLKGSAKKNQYIKDAFVELITLIMKSRKRMMTSRAIIETETDSNDQKCKLLSCKRCNIF